MLRRTLKALGWLTLALLLVVAAWVASNGPWADDAGAPLPPQLAVTSPAIAPQHNAFFDQLGLRAPAGESPNVYGQRVMRGEPEAPAQALLALPTSAVWHCQPKTQDCIRLWRAAALPLHEEMARVREFGQRCLALSSRPGYDEQLMSRQTSGPLADKPFASYPLPIFAGLSSCLRWFQVTAALAADLRESQDAWGRADSLRRRVAGGSKSLISQAMAWSWAASQTQLLAQWLAQTPGATLDDAWLRPLPATVLEPSTWIKAEAHFQRQIAGDVGMPAQWIFDDEPNLLQRSMNRINLGYLPHATQRLQDALWLSRLQQLGSLQGAALAQQAPVRQAEEEPSLWTLLYWRNTLGHIVVKIGAPEFLRYFMSQADASAHPQLLQAVVALNARPPSDRPMALAALPLSAELREQLRLDGDTLVWRGWQHAVEPARAAPLRLPLKPG
ncbi:MAG: hypothetical protein EKK53_12905 [Burkholderiales bacterium]|nr:MAG: hypothetical protein EKK53_12905 [Burkholderiales bacterium]